MKIALIDDDVSILEQLSELISNELFNIGNITYQIHTFTSGEDFLAGWQTGKYDLIILDIYMTKGGLLGVDVAHKIRQTDADVRIAFCTTSNEFAAESYEVDAKYYLQKPITQANVAKMIKRLNLETIEQNRTVLLPNGYALLLRQILYTEYSNHTVTIYLKDETTYKLRISQKEMEDLLCPYGCFCAPNKGLTVNFHEVKCLREEMFIMSNGMSLPISRRKLKDVKEAYINFSFSKLRKEMNS